MLKFWRSISSKSINRRVVGQFLADYGLLLMLLILMVIFASLNPHFFTFGNFKNLIEQNAVLGIVSVGMTFAIISRNIDLSPGSVIALSGVIVGLIYSAIGNIWLSFLGGILASVLIYLFNGFVIAKIGINSLIVTLAAWIWARGLAISLTGANSIVIRDPVISFINSASFAGISIPITMVILAYILGWILLNRTKIGRYVFAIGGDERSTIIAGINVERYKMIMFGVLGFFTGFATIVALSRLGAAAPDAAYGLELDAIVAVIIGGNPFQGAEGSLRKTFIGVLFIAVLNNGLNNLGMRDSYFYLYKGIAIIFALFFDVISHRMLLTMGTSKRLSESSRV